MGIFRKLGHSIRKHKREVAVSVSAMAIPVTTAVSAFAAETGITDIKAAMSSAMDTMKLDIVEMVATILPPALAVMGIGLAVAYGLKFFRKIAAK